MKYLCILIYLKTNLILINYNFERKSTYIKLNHQKQQEKLPAYCMRVILLQWNCPFETSKFNQKSISFVIEFGIQKQLQINLKKNREKRNEIELNTVGKIITLEINNYEWYWILKL